MRIACLVIPNLATQLAQAEEPGLGNQPIIIGRLPFEKGTVYDASPEAIASGIRPGMPLRQAQALCPEAPLLSAAQDKYEEAIDAVIRTLDNFSPVIEVVKQHRAYLDITGVQNESGTARALISTVLKSIRLHSSIGVASGKFFCLVAASASKKGCFTIVPPGKEKEFITPFSIDFVDCEDPVKERLHFLGIKYIGQLAKIPREALLAQFGSEGLKLYQITQGIDHSPLIPLKKPDLLSIACDLEPPLVTSLEIVRACQVALAELIAKIENQDKLCYQILCKVYPISGMVIKRRLPLKEPTSSERAILDRLRIWVEQTPFSAPVARIELSLWLCAEAGKKLSLWSNLSRRQWQLGGMASELKRRFGYQPLKKAHENPNEILPERRYVLTDLSD